MQRHTKLRERKLEHGLPAAFIAMVLAISLSFAGCAGTAIDGGGMSDNGDSSGMTDDDSNGNNRQGGDDGGGSTGDGGQDGNGDTGNNGNGSGGSTGNNQDVDDSLNKLGVDTRFSSRIDEKQEEIEESFSPLGASSTIAQTDELFLVGLQLSVETPAGTFETLDNRAAFVELADDDTGIVDLAITDALEPGQIWESDTSSPHPGMGGGAGSLSTRAATAGDIDGDGLDEIIIVYTDPQSPARVGEIYVEILDDQSDEGKSAASVTRIAFEQDVVGVTVAAVNFNGDRYADLLIGISTPTRSDLLFVTTDSNNELFVMERETKSFTQRIEGSRISIELAGGNIDHDNAEETVVVVNEFDRSANSGTARYWIIDDEANFFREIVSDELVIGVDGGAHVALVADVALGDIDADGRDEIILAGLTEFHNDACVSYGHIYVALDDAESEFNALRSIGARFIEDPYVEPGTGCNSNSHQIRVRKVHVNAFDLDGDGVDEIQANRYIFEDFAEAPPWTEAGNDNGLFNLPYSEFLPSNSTVGGTLSNVTSNIVTGDVTGDGRENVIVFVQWVSEIHVWGLLGPSRETATWSQAITLNTERYNGQSKVFPIIVPCDVDKDGLALKYSEGEYRFVFTEPILIAALAAAPCADGIGQNTDACVTAFGQTEGQSGGIDGTITVSASTFVSVEAKDPFFGIGAGASSRLTASASFTAGLSYQLEETIEFTTGPLEDTVIFTTVPLDQYIYEIVSHPDPDLVGETMVINLPRSPITLQVEREFYNQSVADGSFKVSGNVFLHTEGDLDSYPTEADADALIDTGGLGHLGPLGELVDAVGEALGPIAERLLGNGLKTSRPATVGQGGGQTSTEIRFSESTSYRAGAEIAYESEVSVSAGGFTAGTTIGGSLGAGISWGTSSSTVYRGTVGSIDADNFSDNVYNFGLFTYIYNYGDPSKQQFEVINYWVERQ